MDGCRGAQGQEAYRLVLPEERSERFRSQARGDGRLVEVVLRGLGHPRLEPHPEFGVLAEFASFVRGQRLAERHRTARRTTLGERHHAARTEHEDDHSVYAFNPQSLGADTFRGCLDGRGRFQAGERHGGCGSLPHLPGQAVGSALLLALQHPLPRDAEEHHQAGAGRDGVQLEGPPARHHVQEGTARNGCDRQPVGDPVGQPLVSLATARAKAPRGSSVCGDQDARREDEVSDLDAVGATGDEPGDPAFPGQREQHDAGRHQPDSSERRLDPKRQRGDDDGRGAGKEEGGQERDHEIRAQSAAQDRRVGARQQAVQEPVGHHEGHGREGDDESVQGDRPACARLEPSVERPHADRDRQDGTQAVGGVRHGADQAEAEARDGIRDIPHDLAERGQRQACRQRSTEETVLALLADGDEQCQHSRERCDGAAEVLEQDPEVAGVGELEASRDDHGRSGQNDDPGAGPGRQPEPRPCRPVAAGLAHTMAAGPAQAVPGHARAVTAMITQPSGQRQAHVLVSPDDGVVENGRAAGCPRPG